ncbi:MAG: hypothetical protein ACE5LL_03150 [Alphaproteobacteria bacterium]
MIVKVSRCTDCGVETVPFFGFPVPCERSVDGDHHHVVVREQSGDLVAARLWDAYQAVPSFDQAAFARHAGPEARALLELGALLYS